MLDSQEFVAPSEADTRAIGGSLSGKLRAGDIVLLDGPLGAGKTTFVRGFVESLGMKDAVRSPTFNLIQTFDTQPPVMHADLYRVASYQGIGIEDYFDSHICLIEWPDRISGLLDGATCWRVHIDFKGDRRLINIQPPDISAKL